ncbi:MAG: PPOX class F420-dependent oxidoreductase [Rubrobacter sp.]
MSEKSIVPEKYTDILDSKTVAHVATIGPKGEPQNNPVWFGWDGEFVKISQTKGRQKFKNVGRNPQVALSFVDLENHLRYIEIRGEVDHIDEDPDNAFINEMAKKYIDKDIYPYHQPGDERVVLFIRPEHTTQMGS